MLLLDPCYDVIVRRIHMRMYITMHIFESKPMGESCSFSFPSVELALTSFSNVPVIFVTSLNTRIHRC